ncbi:MAG: isochorismatase family protein [Lautropia sp.]|nr:isochorismatase family protein [Lautropia sp.]
MLLQQAHSALILVDYQTRLMPFIHEGQAAVDEAVFLGKIARLLDVPVIGTEQNSTRLGPNDDAIAALCQQMLEKRHFNAAADGLGALIERTAPGARQIVVAGCEAHVCLLQTALGLLSEGFEVFVVPDACSSRKASDKALAMQRLSQAGVTLVSAESVAFEWLHHCDHPRFKEALALIKPH